jgi:DNA-binding transcriptional ArsR family regulator
MAHLENAQVNPCINQGRASSLPHSLHFDISGNMDEMQAVEALSALGQPTRLQVFRLLVKAGPEGLAAGAVAGALGVPANTMSTHLSLLVRAGLAQVRRDGRSMIYTVDQAGTRALLAFLVADCCGGRPEMCAPLLQIAEQACRESPKAEPGGCA